VSADRPINADVPVPDSPAPAPPDEPTQGSAGPKAKAKSDPSPAKPDPTPAPVAAPGEIAATSAKPASDQRQSRPRRKPVPGALKGIAALVIVAIVFIAAAVIGGSGGAKSEPGSAGPAPAPAPAEAETAGSPATQTAEELGYPTFATGNTTRVGGSEPAANAAAVALAVFPSTTPAQQPQAVTLVGEDDWAGAIAAAVLMSAPVRAPVLISANDGLPDPTADALDALDPQGGASTAGAGTFAIGEVATPDGTGKVTSVDEGGAAATAAAIAALRDRLFGSPPAHVLVAPSGHPELAMPAAAWAARSGDPVLFAEGDRLPKATATALKRHPDVPVYVLGPSSAISSKAIRAIAKIAGKVHRVSGEDPVANAIAFARYANGSFGWNVNDPGHGFVLARKDSPLDAAAAAALSASGTWGPLLLTDSAATLPKALREYFLDVKPGYTTNPTRAFYNHVWVIGDQEAIDVNQQAEVNELAELAKIGGAQQ
jgi:ell wall binding domain 2 (CWB2)